MNNAKRTDVPEAFKLTPKEKVIASAEKFVKKHNALFYPCMIITAVFIMLITIFDGLCDNKKRIMACFCSVVFFFSCSSFESPVLSMDSAFVSSTSLSDDSQTDITNIQDYSSPQSPEADAVSNVSAASSSEDEMSYLDYAGEEGFNESDFKDHESDTTVDKEDQFGIDDIMSADVNSSEDTNSTDSLGELTFSSDDWKLILINQTHSIPDGYDFPLSSISGSMYCDKRIIGSLQEMFKAAQNDGVNLVVCSPYRSESRQKTLFSKKCDNYVEDGMTYMDAYSQTALAVTIPGTSEHQAGLAIDIISDNYYRLDEGFGDTTAGKWLRNNCAKYGFVLRYLEDKEEITGIEYEPWHFRYVGVDAATVMMNENITLEEFWDEYIYG